MHPKAAPREIIRPSQGLKELSFLLDTKRRLRILDLGPVSQENVLHFTHLGHKLFAADPIYLHDEIFGPVPADPQLARPELIQRFLFETLHFPESSLDAVLLWTLPELCAKPLLDQVVERLEFVLKPGGCVFAMFHETEAGAIVPVYSFRIKANDSLGMIHRGDRPARQIFTNRTAERLIPNSTSVKLFLTRQQGLREVIVKVGK